MASRAKQTLQTRKIDGQMHKTDGQTYTTNGQMHKIKGQMHKTVVQMHKAVGQSFASKLHGLFTGLSRKIMQSCAACLDNVNCCKWGLTFLLFLA